MTIARTHFLKHQAQAAAEQAAEYGGMQNLNAYEQQLLQLNSDRQHLKNMQSDKLRTEYKAQQLPQYLPYVRGILQARPNVPDEVVTEVMVWAVDTGNFNVALDVAEYVLPANLPMPDRFGRNVASFITEDTADRILSQLSNLSMDDLNVVYLPVLVRLENLISRQDLPNDVKDMPDQVKAKLYLVLGRAYAQLGQYELAKTNLETALSFNEHCGGKTNLKQVLKHLEIQGEKSP